IRLFWLYYEDARDNPVKVDNRPLPVRTADKDEIAIHTVGAHAIAVKEAGPDRRAPLGRDPGGRVGEGGPRRVGVGRGGRLPAPAPPLAALAPRRLEP